MPNHLIQMKRGTLYNLLSKERQVSLQEWINIHLKPHEIKSFNEYHSSAQIKIAFPSYLTNGEVKGAMLAAGFKAKDRSKKNWNFNISKKQCNYLLQDKKIIWKKGDEYGIV